MDCSPRNWQATPTQWRGLRNNKDGTFGKTPKKFEKTGLSRFKCAFKGEGFFINTLKYCQKPSKKFEKTPSSRFKCAFKGFFIGITHK